MPSSISRSSDSSSSSTAASSSSTAARAPNASDAADLDEDVLARRHGELERVARGEPQLVDSLNVLGVGDRDPQRAVVERVGNRDQPLENVQRDLATRLDGNARQRQVDERHVVTRGQRLGDALARGDVVLDQRMGERAHPGRAADHGQLVRRDEPGGGDQVRDELGERIDRRRATSEACAGGRRRAAGLRARGAQIRWALGVHIPRSRYRQPEGSA
jgi:hypothetical protein